MATIDAGTISAAAYRLAGAWQAGSAAASLNSGLAINGAPQTASSTAGYQSIIHPVLQDTII